jgi:hypothetical protein
MALSLRDPDMGRRIKSPHNVHFIVQALCSKAFSFFHGALFFLSPLCCYFVEDAFIVAYSGFASFTSLQHPSRYNLDLAILTLALVVKSLPSRSPFISTALQIRGVHSLNHIHA